jgi:TolA-binding protein
MGAKVGATYLVYADGRQVLDMDGVPLGRDKIPLAALKITSTSGNFSECVVAAPSKASVLARGDKIEPRSSKELKDIPFPRERPRDATARSSDTMAALFGNDSASVRTGAVSPSETPALPAPDSPEDLETQEVVPITPEPLTREPLPENTQDTLPAATALLDFDPNESTDSKVIDTYLIADHEKRTLAIQQRGAYNMYKNKNYKGALESFSQLAEAYPSVNYLSAYWAGMSALKMKGGSKEEAAKWFDMSIEINPNYQPSIDQKVKLGKGKK